jgi:hypothetical protein
MMFDLAWNGLGFSEAQRFVGTAVVLLKSILDRVWDLIVDNSEKGW